MLCRKISTVIDKGTIPVYLNVYDLTPINGYAYWFGLGVYHSGVEVYGVEYAYGAHELPLSGIFEGVPKKCEGFTFRKSILIGKTDMEEREVKGVMKKMEASYKGNSYNLITKNCNHFCNDVCLRLTGNPIPNWVNRLARIGFMCKCVLPATMNVAKVRNNRICEGKTSEEETEKKKLKSLCNTETSSSSSSSSPVLTRGRSRNRRPRSSPLVRGSSPV